MSHIVKTKAGTYRANWRDHTDRQRSKTFATKREATAFLAEINASLNRGTYVDPHAGKSKFGPYAETWLKSRNHELATAARDESIMRNHVLARWRDIPLGKIDHSAVQAWITDLGKRLSPASVIECNRLLSGVLRSAVRDRIIGANPCEGVRLPRRRRQDDDDRIITREEFTTLLRHVPDRYRAVVALAAGAGLRWGECAGLRWDAVDLDAATLRVLRVAVEINGHITIKPYPKSRAGRREVPLPGFAVDLLTRHRAAFPAGPLGEVFTGRSGNLMSRHTFRARVWWPSLVRAGLLGSVTNLGDGFLGTWTDKTGTERRKRFPTREEAVSHLAQHAGERLRFHDLRHHHATWLVSEGIPVNDVAGLIGHEQISTTLNRYTHASRDRGNRARAVFADFSLTPVRESPAETGRPSPEGEPTA
ncbi:tyrosine-type recombinase/integrase [Streptosporangium sandarakinum]|uniref:tyrosine-type recombinase/integrase n=1 Tax=Streptosporangium sandarakinum TaxID=1260955 RepID=UPI0036982F69